MEQYKRWSSFGEKFRDPTSDILPSFLIIDMTVSRVA